MIYHRVCNQINTTDVTSGAGTAYPSGAPEYIPDFQLCSCYSIFGFMCMVCIQLFVLLYFLFWPLCCLFFFDIRILITPLWYLQSLLMEPNRCCKTGQRTRLECGRSLLACSPRVWQIVVSVLATSVVDRWFESPVGLN